MMTPKPTPKATNPKAQSTAPSPVIATPPDDWQLNSAFGIMAADSTPAGRLVRLAEVLRWIEQSQSIPRLVALKVFCDALPADVMQWLYWVQPGDYAKPVPVDYLFGYQSKEQIEKDIAKAAQARLQREWEADQNTFDGFRGHFYFTRSVIGYTHTLPTEPGFPALYKIINKTWENQKRLRSSVIEILDDPKVIYLTPLSISINKAAEIWGYGKTINVVESTPVNFVELVKYRKENEGAAWIDSHIEILRSEAVIRQGRPSYRKKLADELGISTARIGQLLHQNRAKPMRANAPNLRKVA